MAKPVITWRSSVYSTGAGPTYQATTSWTPAANSLIVAFVVGNQASAPTDPTGVAAHGVNLSQINLGANTDVNGAATHICSIWVGDAGASPTNSAALATFTGTRTGAAVIEYEVTGWEVNDGPLNAFARIDTAEGSGTTGTVTLQLASDVTSEHVLMSFFVHTANEVTTPRTNWTETAGADGNYNNPATGAETQFRTDAYELTATATWATSTNWRGYALVVRGTATTPEDSVKVSDQLSVSITPIFTTLTENVEVTDGPITFPVGDLDATLTENLKVDDIGQGATQLIGPIRIQDILTASLDPLEASPQEILKVSDVLTVGPLDLSASPTESIKVTDALTVTPLDLTTGLLTESVKVSDTATLLLNPLEASPTDTIKVTDTLTVAPLDLMASLEESVKVTDASESYAQLTYDEFVHIADVLAVTLDPLQTAPSETVKIADVLTPPQMALSDVNKTETVKLTDTPTVLLNPEQATPTESVKVSDQIAVTLNPLNTSIQDSVKVSDSAAGSFDLERAITAESVKVADTVTAQLATLVPSLLTDAVKVSDTAQGTLVDQGELTISLQESLKVQDSPAIAIDPLLVSLTDAVKVSESAFAIVGAGSLNEEHVKVRDVLAVLLDPLEATPSEQIRVRDDLILNPATDVVTIHVRPSRTQVHVRPRITTIKVREP